MVRCHRGQPVRAFEQNSGHRGEVLDFVVYSFAARQLVKLDLGRREKEIASPIMPKRLPSVVHIAWLAC